MADRGADRVSDDEYMNPYEFARLPSSAHHAVWKAAAEGRIDWVPATPGQPNGVRCYHRAQVQALLAGLKAASA